MVPGLLGGRQFVRVARAGDRLTMTMVDGTHSGATEPDWSGKMQTQFVLKRVH